MEYVSIKKLPLIVLLVLYSLVFYSCGGSTSNNTTDNQELEQTINTQKLVGTPFEGLEIGDDFTGYEFICGQYKTETIDTFPIYIFAAFFTDSEEEIIQEGIDIANEAIGFTAYELTDTWSDDVRIIYKVRDVEGGKGEINSSDNYYNGNIYSELIASDWIMRIENYPFSKWLVAHELGHATGISSHALIDYDNNTTIDLEENSLMKPTIPSTPVLNDYNYMMNMQGQIMQNHLGEIGELRIDWCE